MSDYNPNTVLSNQEYNVVGTRPRRHDALDKVTGHARFSADIHLPGMLHGKMLRSPHAHAKIKSIDTNRALELPGVKAVATGQEFTQYSGLLADIGEGDPTNYKFLSNNCLAYDKVLYKGHAVAAVAATTPETAEQALDLIKVEYEVLAPVLDGREAMKNGAPILHERLETIEAATPGMRPGGTRSEEEEGKDSNVAVVLEFGLGDVEKGFKEADVIVELETHTAAVHQGYIEPHSATVLWNSDGEVTVWSSSQGQFAVRERTATILGLPISKVKAIPMEIGGGFGGKLTAYLEPVAGLLSRKAGGPVKMTMTRAEVF